MPVCDFRTKKSPRVGQAFLPVLCYKPGYGCLLGQSGGQPGKAVLHVWLSFDKSISPSEIKANYFGRVATNGSTPKPPPERVPEILSPSTVPSIANSIG